MRTCRREFLKRSAAGLAGAGLAAAIPAAARTRVSAGDTLTVGLIGCKNMGWSDLEDFLRQPGVACAALADVDAGVLSERAAEAEGLTGRKPAAYGDYRRLLERKDIDAVIVGTPDHWHCLPFVEACEAGKDVYIEKPLANSIGEGEAMAAAAARTGRVVQVGQQQRSGTHWASAMALVRSGALGKIRRVKCWAHFDYGSGRAAVPDGPVPEGVDFDFWLGPAPARSFNANRFHGYWRLYWDYGGGLQTDWGVHLIDMALWGMNVEGPPLSVSAAGGLFAAGANGIETFDTQTAVYRFDDWILTWEHDGGIQTGPYGRNYGVAFVGTNGTLVADREAWQVFEEGSGEDRRMEAVPPQVSDHQDHVRHVRDFIECVKTRRTPAAGVAVGRLAAFYAHLGNIAARTGRALAWDAASGAFAGDPGASALLTPAYRAPWAFPSV